MSADGFSVGVRNVVVLEQPDELSRRSEAAIILRPTVEMNVGEMLPGNFEDQLIRVDFDVRP